MNLFTILNANNYLTVNREIARKIGINAAIFLSEIIDKFCYFEARGQLDDGWFYLTVDDAESRTTLKKDCQTGAIKILKELGFIETKQRGMPAKRYFKVDKKKITDFVNSDNKKEEVREQERVPDAIKVEEFPTPAPIYKSQEEEPEDIDISAESAKATQLDEKIAFSFESGEFKNISEKDKQAWSEAYPGLNVELALKQAVQWCLSNTAARKKTNWRKFLTNWLSRGHEHLVNRQAYHSQRQSSGSAATINRRPLDKDGNPLKCDTDGLF